MGVYIFSSAFKMWGPTHHPHIKRTPFPLPPPCRVFWPSGNVIAWAFLCLSVCHTKLVHAITHHPFNLGSQNLDQRSQLFWGVIDIDLQCQITWNSNFTPFSACLHNNSSPIQARITKYGPEMQNVWSTVHSRPSHAHWVPAHWDLHTGPQLPATTSIDHRGNYIFTLCWMKCNILMYKIATHKIWLFLVYYLYFLILDMYNYVKIYTKIMALGKS